MPVIPRTPISDVGRTHTPVIKAWDTDRRTMASGNGTTDFGRVDAGTVMGEVTATGEVRPAFRALAAGAVSAATTITIDNGTTENLFVGDAIYDDGADTGETVASITSATVFEASGNVTIADNSVITVGDGSDTAVGILSHDATTWEPDVDENGAAQNVDQSVELVTAGVVLDAELTPASAASPSDSFKSDLSTIVFRANP